MKKVVFSFGRMNPPTSGHQKLVTKLKTVAKQKQADVKLYLSHTQNNKKDPLDYNTKISIAKKAFGDLVTSSTAKTIIEVLKELQSKGYTDIFMVVGSDRVKDFSTLINKYNGKEYRFNSIQVVSAGQRDPDAEDVSGMSASKMRAFAKEGNFKGFKEGLPPSVKGDAKAIFDKLRSIMENEELDEALDMKQRMARSRMMKRLAPKLARMKKNRHKRMADSERLKKRARKQAKELLRTKILGKGGQHYKDLSTSQKITVDRMVDKKSASIGKIAQRLLPSVKKAEVARVTAARTSKNEEYILEGVNTDTVRDKIDKEQIKDKKKFSKMRERARQADANIRDTRIRLAQESYDALERKAEMSGIPFETIKEEYELGVENYSEERTGTAEQQAFQRVNSYIANLDEEVTAKQIQDLEKFGDRLLQKFDIDIEFTRHFADRMNDKRNNPEIKVSEIQKLFKKIAKGKGSNIKQNPDTEVVLKDMQADLNLPVAIKYDKNKDEFEVVNKTIMRKKDFKTSNKVLNYESFMSRKSDTLDEISSTLANKVARKRMDQATDELKKAKDGDPKRFHHMRKSAELSKKSGDASIKASKKFSKEMGWHKEEVEESWASTDPRPTRRQKMSAANKLRMDAEDRLKKRKAVKKEDVELDERSPFGDAKVAFNKMFNKNYDKAKEWMKKTGKSPADAARMFKGVDARELAKMVTEGDKACWKDYEMIGTKEKNGKTVPNCVPKKEEKVTEAVSPEKCKKRAKDILDKAGAGQEGTDELVKSYVAATPGMSIQKEGYSTEKDALMNEDFSPIYTAKDLGIKAQGAFAYHPSVEEFIEDKDADETIDEKCRKGKK
jgi:nicotinic acid mononucleotide adenylyltransferase